jgi:hypothetical protein
MGYRQSVNEKRLPVNVVATALSAITVTTPAPAALYVGDFTELAVDLNVTAVAGTTPSITIKIERQGADGVWYTIYTGAAVTAAGAQSTDIGVGAATNKAFGSYIRVTETIAGSAGQSVTRSLSIIGK